MLPTYRGTKFCSYSTRCATTMCHKKITSEVRRAAQEWWDWYNGGKADTPPPFSLADFSGTCLRYEPLPKDIFEKQEALRKMRGEEIPTGEEK